MAAAYAHHSRLSAEHIIGGLCPEARIAWAEVVGYLGGEGQESDKVHETIHRGMARLNRHLREVRSELAIHAAALEIRPGIGLLLPGASHAGKSTYATVASVLGFGSLLADDHVWLEGRRISGIGAPVSLRSGSPLWCTAQDLWYATDELRLMVRPVDLGAHPAAGSCEVRAIVFVRYDPQGSGILRELGPAETFCRVLENVRSQLSPGNLMNLAQLAYRCTSAELEYRDAETSAEAVRFALETGSRNRSATPMPVTVEELRRHGFHQHVVGIRFGDEVVFSSPVNNGSTIMLRGWAADPSTNTAREVDELGFARIGQFSA